MAGTGFYPQHAQKDISDFNPFSFFGIQIINKVLKRVLCFLISSEKLHSYFSSFRPPSARWRIRFLTLEHRSYKVHLMISFMHRFMFTTIQFLGIVFVKRAPTFFK